MWEKKNRNKVISLVITIVAALLLLWLGPLDICVHGNYIYTAEFIDIGQEVLSGQAVCIIEFVPERKHFTGFGVRTAGIPGELTGNLAISVMDAGGKTLDSVKASLDEAKGDDWYRMYFDVRLKVGSTYTCTIELEDSSLPNDALENLDSDSGIYLGYMYAESTFSLIEKALFGLLILSVWLFCISALLWSGRKRAYANQAVLFLVMIFGLTWNYMYNSLDNQNDRFYGFQGDSEALVMSAVSADHEGIVSEPYGLGSLSGETLNAYRSQYGLQGKIFRFMARYISLENTLTILNFLCCVAAAFVFSVIVALIGRKYNVLMAGCFLAVFWLSPWIVNFARNLYWVEFTWFIPMAAGLFCSLYIDRRNCRIISYTVVFVSIMIKCLCGYEYISTIMLGSVAYLAADLMSCLIQRNKKQAALILRTLFILGTVALLGFFAAVCIHARLRGEGSITEGMRRIFEQDVLRRTLGGDMNNFDQSFWDSINASIWQTFSRYFHFETEVITGVDGNLFPMVCIVPLILFAYNYKIGKPGWNDVILYAVCFITSISWFILAKQHSYNHPHMNYVLWYFGYVQVCFYVICRQAVSLFQKREGRFEKE